MVHSARILLISAAASGQGKTTVAAALARKCRNMGLRVRVFKTGPDFLDPMLLERASGAPVFNLDMWMVGEKQSRSLLAKAALDSDLILIEGVMGLYDGEPSSADLANAFGLPVLAVLDASKMAQTAGALMMGLRDYGPVHLAGVIANRLGSERHKDLVKGALRDIPLLGTLPRQPQSLPERHLGIVQPDETDRLETLLGQLADQLDFDQQAYEHIPRIFLDAGNDASLIPASRLKNKTIAIARDAAFSFIYPANIEWLRSEGANLSFFSPLDDEPVPSDADAVWLPGGYPELHARTLSSAQRWIKSVHSAHAEGLPILAECGGLMALAEHLADSENQTWPMAGLLPGSVSMQKRLAALGMQEWISQSGALRGHAFHYSRLETAVEPIGYAARHPVGGQGEAVYRLGSLTASYFHAYFPSCPDAAAHLFSREDACLAH